MCPDRTAHTPVATGRFEGRTASRAEIPEIIRTKRVEVVDNSGKVRAVVGSEKGGSGMPEIILYDEGGGEAALLTLDSRGLGTMVHRM